MEKFCLIPLRNKHGLTGEFAKCSSEDYDELIKYKWSSQKGYPMAMINNKSMRMHIFVKRILEKITIPDGHVIDHINNDRLDNRRDQLAIKSMFQNAANKKKSKNLSSGFIGVSVTSNWKFVSNISIEYQNFRLGTFDTEREAAEARDMFIVHHPNYVNLGYNLNFPDKLQEYLSRPANSIPIKRVRLENKQKIYIKINIIDENTIAIFCKNSIPVLIDKEDYEKLKYFKISQSKDTYTRIKNGSENYMIHRYIMDVKDPKIFVDHINGDIYDCRKSNLRLSNAQLNSQNKKKRKLSSSKYYGVTFNKYREMFRCKVNNGNKVYADKHFNVEEDAARYRDLIVFKFIPNSHFNMNFEWSEEDKKTWNNKFNL